MSPTMRDVGIRSFTVCADSVFWAVVVVTSTIGLAPLTVTVSSTLPTFSTMFTLAVKPTPSWRSFRTVGVKPESS